MARETQTVVPTREARQLFNSMVNHADDSLHLSLSGTVALAADRAAAGLKDTREIDQLKQEGWIRQAGDGGWRLD